jgi:hypothetical protein
MSDDHFNGLTPAEDERLALMSEECAEVIHIISKIQRHGYENRHPFDQEGATNRVQLCRELGHVRAAMRLMMREGDVNESLISEAYADKTLHMHDWLHHQNLSKTKADAAVPFDLGPITNR